MREDQAQGLRQLFARRTCRLAALAGSRGATVSVAIAAALGGLGYRVCVLDRSVGDAAHAVGRRAKYDLAQVLDGDCTLDQAALKGPDQVVVLPAARGLDRLAVEAPDWESALRRAAPALSARFDLWLVNGLLPGPAPDAPMILAVDPSAQAITNAYAHIKALARAQGRRRFGVVVHAAASAAIAERVYGCVAGTARRFLGAELDLYGWVPPFTTGGCGGADAAGACATAFERIADHLMAALSTPPLLRTGS